LTLFWFVGNLLGQWLGPTTSFVLTLVVLAVTLACIGSMVVSKVLGGKDFDHLAAGFMLALPGWLLMHFLFHWDLSNPANGCTAFFSCWGEMLVRMLVNTLILVVGMALVCIPVLPVLWRLHQRASIKK